MIEPENILNTIKESQDSMHECTLRPRLFSEYIGQNNAKEQLNVFIRAAKSRQEALDHVLIYGPPGLGKTTLANIISHEIGANIRHTSGPIIEKAGDLAAILTHLQKHDVLFIDEIHRLNPAIEEILYPALEDYRLDIMIGEGPSARTVQINLPPFTLIGATTRAGMLTNPLRDRFGILLRLDFYTPEELSEILQRTAYLLNAEINKETALEIAKRSRGTPRIANRLLKRIRDVASLDSTNYVSTEHVYKTLQLMNIDQKGLNHFDRHFLSSLIQQFNGGPVGIDALAASLAEEKDTIEDIVEPFLMQQGFLQRTARGRIATCAAYEHLNLPKK